MGIDRKAIWYFLNAMPCYSLGGIVPSGKNHFSQIANSQDAVLINAVEQHIINWYVILGIKKREKTSLSSKKNFFSLLSYFCGIFSQYPLKASQEYFSTGKCIFPTYPSTPPILFM